LILLGDAAGLDDQILLEQFLQEYACWAASTLIIVIQELNRTSLQYMRKSRERWIAFNRGREKQQCFVIHNQRDVKTLEQLNTQLAVSSGIASEVVV